MKRYLSLALVFVMILTTITPVLASSQYEAAGKLLSDLEILKGDENGNLMLDKNFKRQDMVIMISRLYKQEDIAKSYKGQNVFKDLTSQRKFYIPYVTWAKDKNLITGMEVNEFGFGRETTIQEFQTVLLRVLGYDAEAKDWFNVPTHAKNIGIMTSLEVNPSNKLTRGQMAQMVQNTLNQNVKGKDYTLAKQLNLDVPDQFRAQVNIDKDSVNFEGKVSGTKTLKVTIRPTSPHIASGSKTHDITLNSDGSFSHTISGLQKGNYEYRLEGDNSKTLFQPFVISDDNFKLEDIHTDNLKEISLNFNKPVDVNSASILENYKTDAGNIVNVLFENDNKTIVLRLENHMKLNNKYHVSATKIVSTTNASLNLKDKEFVATGSDLPKVVHHYGHKNYVTIQFSKEMDMSTVTKHSNYFVNIKDQINYLPTNSVFKELGNNTISITLPTHIAGVEVEAGKNFKSLEVMGLKDQYGNNIEPLKTLLTFDENSNSKSKAIDFYNDIPGKQGVFLDKNTIQIKFNVPIEEASSSDFRLSGESNLKIDKVIADGSNIVTLKLDNKNNTTGISDGELSINYNNKIKSLIGSKVEGGNINLVDKVAPSIDPDVNSLVLANSTVYIPFTEKLEKDADKLFARDIEITKNGQVLRENEYDTFLDPNQPNFIRLIIRNYDSNSNYLLRLRGGEGSGNINYIRDTSGNVAIPSGQLKIN